jgi:hypothetical protein
MNNSSMIFDYENYPIVPVRFKSNDRKTPIIEGLLDSGGDFIVIPMPIAKYLNLNIEPACDVDTAGGTTPLYKANVDIIIGNREKYTKYISKEIHISTRSDIPILLGRNPLFDDNEITFKKQKNQLILTPLNMEIQRNNPDDF